MVRIKHLQTRVATGHLIKWIAGLLILCVAAFAYADEKVTVFAAASLTNALADINAQYAKDKSVKVVSSFAASSTLAKQIENGAPADIFISADTKWMNYLQGENLIQTASRKDLLRNKLVLIAPRGRAFDVQFDKTFDFAKAFAGKLCMGDTDSVPAGIYAKEALNYFQWWNAVKARIVGTQDVRGALKFVERGECAAGIVYETDAKISDDMELVGTFPATSHPPILYPMAIITNTKNARAANNYLLYLQSNTAAEIFKKYGFSVIDQTLNLPQKS